MATEFAELMKLDVKELESKAKEMKIKIQDLRLQKFMGGEMNTALIGTTRRNLARVLTARTQASKKGAAK